MAGHGPAGAAMTGVASNSGAISRNHPPVIVISGIDGAGKTRIINALQALLQEQGILSRSVWLRYNHYLSKLLLGFCVMIGLTERASRTPPITYHHFYRSNVIRLAYVVLTLIDTAGAALLRLHLPRLFSRKVVIIDRWLIDTFVDLEIDTRMRLTEQHPVCRLLNALRPEGCVTVLLERELDAVLAAREENRLDRTFSRRWELYREHGTAAGVEVLANNAHPEVVARRILQLVEERWRGPAGTPACTRASSRWSDGAAQSAVAGIISGGLSGRKGAEGGSGSQQRCTADDG